MGPRVATQLTKLGYMLSVVLGRKAIDARIYRLLRRVAMDSCIGYHVDVIRTLMRIDNKGMTREQIRGATNISQSTLRRQLEDLEQLRICYRRRPEERLRTKGLSPEFWFVSEEVCDLWTKSLNEVPNVTPQKRGHGLQPSLNGAKNGHAVNGVAGDVRHLPVGATRTASRPLLR
jgi:hypothetical protein